MVIGYYILTFIGLMLLAWWGIRGIKKEEYAGTLLIVYQDHEEPGLLLEISDASKIKKGAYVTFDVKERDLRKNNQLLDEKEDTK